MAMVIDGRPIGVLLYSEELAVDWVSVTVMDWQSRFGPTLSVVVSIITRHEESAPMLDATAEIHQYADMLIYIFHRFVVVHWLRRYE